jgi:hypothetical protein
MEIGLESHAFITLLTTPWFFTVVGGFILLGLALACGTAQARKRASRDKAAATERGREEHRVGYSPGGRDG